MVVAHQIFVPRCFAYLIFRTLKTIYHTLLKFFKNTHVSHFVTTIFMGKNLSKIVRLLFGNTGKKTLTLW